MERNLSKKEKAVLRQLIEKGVQAEYKNALEDAAAIIQKWQNNELTGREAYQELFKSIKENDKFIARRYDHVTGSHYVSTVVGIYRDKQISDEDLSELTDDLREYIKRIAAIFEE